MKRFNNAVGPQVRERPARGLLLPSLGVLSLSAGLQAATQHLAHTMGYPEAFGSSLGPLYAPWAILQWAGQWYAQLPSEFLASGNVGVLTAATGLLCVAAAQRLRSNSSKPNRYLHGSARWADETDIQAAGLFPRRSLVARFTGAPVKHRGVYVGGWEHEGQFRYLGHDGPEHVLVYAPTRSGKGVALVIPTLLSWPESCVVTDLKGELWQLTAGWRQQHAGNRVLCFEPAAQGSCAWNPLGEIRLGTDFEVADVQNLALILVDPDGQGLTSHWQRTAFSLLVGVILHALYKARDEGRSASLASVDEMLADPERSSEALWFEMLKYPHRAGTPHPVVGRAAREMMNRDPEEASSVLSTAQGYLSLYRDPVVEANTTRSDFRIRDLMHHADPVSLYIVTQPADKGRLRPLVRALLNMIVRVLAERLEFEKGRAKRRYKHRLLLMLDEFPSLGRLPILEESLAFLAGYGVKAYLICQDINQLKSKEIGYGPDESITSNCHVQAAFPPNRLETAEHLSKLTGQTTVVKEQITTSGSRLAALQGHVSRTFHEVARPLLTADECRSMPGPKKRIVIEDGEERDEIEEAGDMVVYVAGHPAIYGRQPLYFQDPVFLERAAVPPPKQSDSLARRSEHEFSIRLGKARDDDRAA